MMKDRNVKMKGTLKPLLTKHLLTSHWPNEFTWPSPQTMVGKILSTHYETTRMQIYNATIGSEELRLIITFTNCIIFSLFFGHMGDIKG